MTKRMCCWGCGVALFAAAVVTSAAFADDKKPAKADAPKTDAKAGDKAGGMDPKMAEAFEKMGKIGEETKRLGYMVGDWDYAMKMRMSETEAWQESKGTSSAKWVMDGHHVQADHSGDWNGMPFKGMAITSFDNIKGKYVSAWIDNMCGAIMTSEGSYDEAKKTYTWTSECVCPLTNQPTKMRHTITVVDNNKHVMEWFETKDGKEFKSMEITYTRKGGTAGGVK